MQKLQLVAFTTAILVALIGCNSSAPEHPVKPIATRPPFQIPTFNTLEDKIKYIQDSKAPDSIKQQEIAKIRAGH